MLSSGKKNITTTQFGTISLIAADTLTYPVLPREKYKRIPKINTEEEVPSIVLPERMSGDITLRQ